ncbi:MAG: hypothetical protein QOE18_47, partial [Chloroflexota bacterium]|nr:hypothetical protein [Chloroflexota bacterium]
VRVILDSPQRELSPAWAAPRRAVLYPANWIDAVWLAIHAPGYALRVGAILQAAFLGDVDAEV